MGKADSLAMKGVAILFMLFLHLFNQEKNVDLCTVFLYIGDTPLLSLLTRCANPVPFFLFLSGYGLYKTNKNRKLRSNIKRVLKLYIHYWISLAIFIPLGAYCCGINRYPGTLTSFVNNFTGWFTTYNGEIWFLFPYVLLVLSSGIIIKLINKFKWYIIFILSGFIYFIAYLLTYKYGSYLFVHMTPYMPILYCSSQFAFVLGMLSAKHIDIQQLKLFFKDKTLLAYTLLLGLMIIRMMIETGVFHVLYAAAFVILFSSINNSPYIVNILCKLGKRSTSMWFVHTYFCYYLFHDFIYSFKYPIFIFICLIAISYCTAIIIDYIKNKILALLKLA